MMKFVKQLYPTGRAYRLPDGGSYELVHDAINEQISKCVTDTKSIYDTLLPDNDNFTEEDAAIWEKRLGLLSNGDLEQRKQNISRKQNYPSNTLGRQSLVYIQDQLQKAGFNVFVHQNKFPDGSGGFTVINPGGYVGFYGEHGDESFGDSFHGFVRTEAGVIGTYQEHGDVEHGDVEHGSSGFPYESIVANYVNKDLEYLPIFTTTQLKATFFIGSQTLPNLAFVPKERELEFRKLILTLKPQQMVVYLLVNYI